MSKFLAGAALVAALAVFASAASAADLIVTSIGVDSWNPVSVQDHGNETATGIHFFTATDDFWAFCVDLEHNVYVTGGLNYQYDYGQLTVTGAGAPIDLQTSNKIGQLATIGIAFANGSDPLKSSYESAIQGAIWALEYGKTVTSADPFIQSKIVQYSSIAYNGGGRARAIISLDGHQNQVIGGVPEPASWALMILGFGAVGATLRRRRAVGPVAQA